MAALNSNAHEPSGKPDGQSRVFDRVCRLVPSSGLQFIDAGLDASHLAMLRAWFTEDEIETTSGVRRVLLPLANDAASDGTIWHPLTFKPLGPSETLSFTGLEAIEPFLDTWVPVPFLRYLGRADSGSLRYDQGPANWARVFVAKPTEGLRGADRLQVVFAFDTRLDMRSRADQTPYLAPNSDDALFASTFMLADAPEELSDYFSQAWVDTWIRDICRAHTSSSVLNDFDEAGFTTAPAPDAGFSLAHTARYLTFLKILKRAANPPQIRFVDSISKSLPTAVSGLDLVIDFGATETTALLIPRNQSRDPDISMMARSAVALRLRDLSNPVDVHSGPIPTVVEFDNQTFGNAALSRRSGRTDAFAWTSLVRIGVEAKRLALRGNATEGLTGLNDIASGLDQTSPSEMLWRFSTPDTPAAKAGRMVTGEALRHMSESGDVTTRADGLLAGPNGESASMAAMRPRFSQSALVGFFIVELLLHAISEINSATPGSPFAQQAAERNDIRHIERIIVTSPIAMSTNERQNLVERVNTAIDLIWRTQQWDKPGQLAQPSKPQLALGIGADVGLQLVYLFTEVRDKFGGSFSDLVDCVRRRTGDPDARDSLRISSLELSRRAAGLTVIDYDVTHDGSVQAGLVLSDRTGFGGDRVVDAIADHHVLAAIEARLTACGLVGAHDFLLDYLADGHDQLSHSQHGPTLSGKRFLTKVLRPAANGIFETYIQMPARGAEGLRRYRLDHLVAMGGGRLEPTSSHFEGAVADAGATGFHLSAITIEIGRRQIKRLVESELWPMVNAMTDAVLNSESDLLLIGGDLAQLPDLLDHVLSRSAVPAGRVVVRGSHAGYGTAHGTQSGNVNGSTNAPRNTTHDTALLGAYMASRNMLVSDGFSLVTGDITQALTSEQRAQPGLMQPSRAAHAASNNVSFGPSDSPSERTFAVVGNFVRDKSATATALYEDITPPPAKKAKSERAR